MGLDTVAVVGAGVMGHGLALHFARYDRDVTLVDHRQSNLDAARDQIRESAAFLREEGLTDAEPDALLDQISFTLDTAAGVADADLVLETVTEDLDVKHAVFEKIAAAAPADAVLATNTSGIPPSRISEHVPDAAGRVVVCHWWNPPYLVTPVEVVAGEETTAETMERVVSFVESVDRTPIVLEKEVPGFVWNRVQMAVIRECMHLLEAGVASLEDIDAAVRDGYAVRTAAVGPFETMDLAGLDLFRTLSDDLYPELSNAEAASDVFTDRLAQGRGGVEVGAGFYDYDEPPERVTERRDRRLAALARDLDDA